MKAATILLLSVILILFYCLTTQGHNSSGKNHGKFSIAKRTEHEDTPESVQNGRKHVICICDQEKTRNLRKRRHMSGHRRHGRMCARNCLPKGVKRGKMAVPIPLT